PAAVAGQILEERGGSSRQGKAGQLFSADEVEKMRAKEGQGPADAGGREQPAGAVQDGGMNLLQEPGPERAERPHFVAGGNTIQSHLGAVEPPAEQGIVAAEAEASRF